MGNSDTIILDYRLLGLLLTCSIFLVVLLTFCFIFWGLFIFAYFKKNGNLKTMFYYLYYWKTFIVRFTNRKSRFTQLNYDFTNYMLLSVVVVDVSLFESMFSTIASEAVKFAATGAVSERQGNQAVNTAPRNVYVCGDGEYVALSASVQTMFERLTRTIGMEQLIDDPRFRTNEDRVEHCDPLNVILSEYFGKKSRETHLSEMEAAGVTVAPVLTAGDLVDHPYAAGRGLFVEDSGQAADPFPIPAAVPRLTETPGKFQRPAPELGEHTNEILEEVRNLARGSTDCQDEKHSDRGND